MIDCHTHLTDDSFDGDRDEVLARAAAAGVTHIAVVGQDGPENAGVLAAVNSPLNSSPDSTAPGSGNLPRLLPFLGLHPDRFADRGAMIGPKARAAVLEEIRRAAQSSEGPDLTGIGEVGLDYWVCQEETRRGPQREAFTELVRLAMELDLPLNVHSRSAGRHAIDLLLELDAKRVLMHAFDGKAGHALRGVEAGFVFSIPPSIVRSPQKRKLVRALPLHALALETDSPVLGPEQGLRNEPANIALSAAAIAEIKGIPESEVREATTATAVRLFGLEGQN